MTCPHCEGKFVPPEAERHPQESAIIKGIVKKPEINECRYAWYGAAMILAVVVMVMACSCCQTWCRGKVIPDQTGNLTR